MFGTCKKAALRFVHARSGTSAVEFAFIAPVLATMLIGTVDFSLWMSNQMRVGNAARAGAEYAVVNGYNSVKISAAIVGATGGPAICANPTPKQSCGCPNGTTGITAATCGSTCANGATAGTYVTSSAEASHSLIFPWPGVTNPITLKASTTVRIK